MKLKREVQVPPRPSDLQRDVERLEVQEQQLKGELRRFSVPRWQQKLSVTEVVVTLFVVGAVIALALWP